MRYALSAEAMRAAEQEAVDLGCCGSLAGLMDRAGMVLAAEVIARLPGGPIAIACGPGNNGGDGWVAARLLAGEGRNVRVVALRAPEGLAEPARSAAERAVAAGVEWRLAERLHVDDGLSEFFAGTAVIVDAVFGFGFHGTVRGAAAGVLDAIAETAALAEADGCPAPLVISADVPSGVDSDTGAVAGPAVRADVTVAFSALKPGLLIFPGAGHAGDVVVADIGVPGDIIERNASLEVPGPGDLRGLLPLPRPDDHKGSRGRVAIVAGSRAYAGAAILAAWGALRMGAGYVYVIAPEPVAAVVISALPNVIVRAVPADVSGAPGDPLAVLAALADADAVVAGPGLTTASGVGILVRELVARAPLPTVLDADALNVLADDTAVLASRQGPLLLTPHPGEAARLLGMDVADVQSDRVLAATRLADVCPGTDAACLLKGPRTIVAGGGRPALVLAGNAGLARAGSGDVLSGMLGTLLAQGLSPFDAAVLGAYVHGRAAEYGTARLTETCFTSSDIVDFLPDAVRELLGG